MLALARGRSAPRRAICKRAVYIIERLQVFKPRMERRRQGAQATGPARNHEQPPAIPEHGSEAAQDMRCAEIIGLDIVIDHRAQLPVYKRHSNS
jgi:hypothetical protein